VDTRRQTKTMTNGCTEGVGRQVKTETSLRTEAAPFTDRESRRRIRWEGVKSSWRETHAPEPAANVHIGGETLFDGGQHSSRLGVICPKATQARLGSRLRQAIEHRERRDWVFVVDEVGMIEEAGNASVVPPGIRKTN